MDILISKNSLLSLILLKLCDRTLYKHVARRQWQSIARQAYQAKVVDVELNLTEQDKQPEQWA